MRVIKILAGEPSFLEALTMLFSSCMLHGRTPARWNLTDTCLLVKRADRPRDADNLRPITLICMFRKLFERLLFKRFDLEGWARLQPQQTGFRNHHSTLATAATAHAALADPGSPFGIAIFLDFRSAFDVVDHVKLLSLLRRRRCPGDVLSLIRSLQMRDVRSRILVNGEVSGHFARRRGVLQGSPLSPVLFNIYIDEVVRQLNELAGTLSLFFADDGAIFVSDCDRARLALTVLDSWMVSNGIDLNVDKCGYLADRGMLDSTRLSSLASLGRPIPRVERYDYLGFPMTGTGIDFEAHVAGRLQSALGRAGYMCYRSYGWTPSGRLAVFKRYLRPMFEYGAPLVWAWTGGDRRSFTRLVAPGWKALLAWISGSPTARCYHVIANVCGLEDICTRFEHLSAAFRESIRAMPETHPLRARLLHPGSVSTERSFDFLRRLDGDPVWHEWALDAPDVALSTFLAARRLRKVRERSRDAHLLRVIPWDVRDKQGRDVTLSAPTSLQTMLLRYRLGTFMWKSACPGSHAGGLCDGFRRGHESCYALPHALRLGSDERRQKVTMRAALGLRTDDKFTDLDFVLAKGETRRAGESLRETRDALRRHFATMDA